jgi:hypothetical protein
MMRVFCNLQRDVAGTKEGRKNSCLTPDRPLRQRAGYMITYVTRFFRPPPPSGPNPTLPGISSRS